MDDDQEEQQAFYRKVQDKSILKVCSMCDEDVKILPQYDKCNSCMDKLERGYQI